MRREIYTIRSGAVKGDLWVSARLEPTGDEWRKDIQKATYPSFDFMKNWKTDAPMALIRTVNRALSPKPGVHFLRSELS